MASIETRERKDGTLSYRVVWRDPDTKKKESYSFEDPTIANQWVKVLNANGQRLAAARSIMDALRRKVPTIATIIDDYIEHLTGIEARTKKDYRSYARLHINPYLGAFPVDVDNLDRLAAKWVNDRWDDGEGMGGKTLRNVHSFLSAAIGSAVPKHRADNPFHGMKLPEYTPDEMVFLTKGEFSLLISKVPDHYKTAVRFLVSTGLRWGEFVALTVGDLDLMGDTPTVRVTRAVKRAENGTYVGTTKTRRGRRTVSLPESLIPELAGLTFGKAADEALIVGPMGARLRENNFRDRVWKKAITAANAEHDEEGRFVPRELRLNKAPRIHDLRHTHASWLIAAGVDLPTVQRRLGHESITTTVDRYGHLDPDQLKRASDATNAALLAATPL